MSDSPLLTGEHVSKSYGALEVVKNVSIEVAPAEFVCLVGKSGSGKTTLLALLSGMEQPTSGRVTLDDTDLTGSSENDLALIRREKVGFIFQSFHLIPTLSAWENVALPLFPLKMAHQERRSRAVALLTRMDMGRRLEHLPAALSGGEKQRVAIARALVNRPRIVFADEPTGNLDSTTGADIMDILKGLQDEAGVAMLMVTHDHELAGRADRIVRMQDGELGA
ncbi:MAG: ABC transporter ATP-binding protein [Proteobacteria bacterium]|nr:ABC transporter ATP-binding protein [Pseudomonadota bacterium]